MKPKRSSSKRIVGSRNLHIAGGLINGYLRKGNQRTAMASSSSSSSSPPSSSQSTTTTANAKSFLYTCSGCDRPIRRDKFLLKACDKYWHENCLKCDRCHGRLGELGSTLYCKSNMNLCRQDYLELFGETGVCSVCEKVICASEMVMRAKKNVYHLECFACQLCSQRFCVGDRFYLCENKVICQYDYEEHILPIQKSLEQEQHEHVTVYPPPPPPNALGQSEQPQNVTYLDHRDYHLNPPSPQLIQLESQLESRTLLALKGGTTESMLPEPIVSELDKVEAAFGDKPSTTDKSPEKKTEPSIPIKTAKTEETS